MKNPKKIDLSAEEYKSLQERLSKRELKESDYGMILGVIQFIFWLQNSLQEAKISISRLGSLFGFTRKRKKQRKSPKDYDQNQADPDKKECDSDGEESQTTKTNNKKKKGHGRNPHTAYTGASTIQVSLKDLKAGDPCPLACDGVLYSVPPGNIIRVTGSPLAAAVRYQLEKLRCTLCGEYFTAPLPAGVNPDERYDAEAKATITLQKYFLGSPFHRMATFQNLVGMPLPEGTAFGLCEEMGDIAYPIYREFVIQGAQGEVLHNDDTTVKILSLMKENQQDPAPERKGMYTYFTLRTDLEHYFLVKKVQSLLGYETNRLLKHTMSCGDHHNVQSQYDRNGMMNARRINLTQRNEVQSLKSEFPLVDLIFDGDLVPTYLNGALLQLFVGDSVGSTLQRVPKGHQESVLAGIVFGSAIRQNAVGLLLMIGSWSPPSN